MGMLSRRAKYAVRALIFLAQNRGKGPIQIRDISEQLSISRKFLEAILLELRNGGILQSRKGKEGGYLLERSPDTITFGKIMRFIDGSFAAVPCIRRDGYARCEDCPNETTCVIRHVMKQVRDATAKIVDETTLEQLVSRANELSAGSVDVEYQI
jgi:Rrf2 family protein